jgi:serine protease Do
VLVAAVLAPASASELRNSAIVKAVHDNESAVVNIHGHKTVRAENASFGTPPAVRQVNGMGTGVVIDARGYILTNYHVIDAGGRKQTLLVRFSDGHEAPAKVVGTRQ